MAELVVPTTLVRAQTPAAQTKAVSFELPAGPLGMALLKFQQQAGLGPTQLGVAENVIPKLRQPIAANVIGVLAPRDALDRLLAGTGLTFLEDSSGGFMIRTFTSVYVPGGRCVLERDTCHEFVEQGKAISFNVPAGDLAKALGAFKDQSGALAIRVVDAPVLGKNSKGVSGILLPHQALERLLDGTNVTFLEDGYGIYYLQHPANVRVPGGRCKRDDDNRDNCRER
jgi:hypothetical protein